jgi:hypothetical protein
MVGSVIEVVAVHHASFKLYMHPRYFPIQIRPAGKIQNLNGSNKWMEVFKLSLTNPDRVDVSVVVPYFSATLSVIPHVCGQKVGRIFFHLCLSLPPKQSHEFPPLPWGKNWVFA